VKAEPDKYLSADQKADLVADATRIRPVVG
jgi:hypothetical protein